MVETAEAVDRGVHYLRVRDDLADEGAASIVQDLSMSVRRRLDALVAREVRGYQRLKWLIVADYFLVAGQELLFESFSVDFRRAFDRCVQLKLCRSEISMLRTNLEVGDRRRKVTLGPPGRVVLDLRVVVSPDSVCVDPVHDFVEPRQRDLQFSVRRVVLLARRHNGQLVLHYGEHVAHSEEYTPRQLVLVIEGEPLGEHLLDVGLEDLRARELAESFLLEDRKILLCSRPLTESLRVPCCVCHLAEEVRGGLSARDVNVKVSSEIEFSLTALQAIDLVFVSETLGTFCIDNRFDQVKTLDASQWLDTEVSGSASKVARICSLTFLLFSLILVAHSTSLGVN